MKTPEQRAEHIVSRWKDGLSLSLDLQASEAIAKQIKEAVQEKTASLSSLAKTQEERIKQLEAEIVQLKAELKAYREPVPPTWDI